MQKFQIESIVILLTLQMKQQQQQKCGTRKDSLTSKSLQPGSSPRPHPKSIPPHVVSPPAICGADSVAETGQNLAQNDGLGGNREGVIWFNMINNVFKHRRRYSNLQVNSYVGASTCYGLVHWYEHSSGKNIQCLSAAKAILKTKGSKGWMINRNSIYIYT